MYGANREEGTGQGKRVGIPPSGGWTRHPPEGGTPTQNPIPLSTIIQSGPLRRNTTRARKATAMLHFEGDKELSRSPAELYPKLSDARFLVQCIPGGTAVGEPEADRAVCKVKPALSFVTGSLEVTAQITERVPDSSVRVSLHSK